MVLYIVFYILEVIYAFNDQKWFLLNSIILDWVFRFDAKSFNIHNKSLNNFIELFQGYFESSQIYNT